MIPLDPNSATGVDSGGGEEDMNRWVKGIGTEVLSAKDTGDKTYERRLVLSRYGGRLTVYIGPRGEFYFESGALVDGALRDDILMAYASYVKNELHALRGRRLAEIGRNMRGAK